MSEKQVAFSTFRILRVLSVLLIMILCIDVSAEYRIPIQDQWKAIDLQDLSIKPGSALDFSFLVEKGDAGQYGFLTINSKGYFAFEKRPDVPVRFFVAPQLPNVDKSTGIPEFGDWDKQAEQIRLAGYNAIRAHFLDDMLMNGSNVEGKFNPEMVDRWERYTAALKKQGIYLILDAATSDACFYTVKWWTPEAMKYKMKTRLYYDAVARELWMKGVRQIFEHVNPYTGKALKDEPQVAWITLRNESGLNFVKPSGTGKRADPGMNVPFRTWLKQRYPTREAWAAAWGKELKPEVNFENVTMPTPNQKGPLAADLQRFFTDIEQQTYLWGAAFMKSIGIKVPVIDYNNGGSMQCIISRDVLPFVDNHGYHDYAVGYASPGAKIDGHNDITRQASTARWLSVTRPLGRPFSVTEWGGYFWNPYRHQDGMLFAAYLRYQNIQLLAQHAEPVRSTFQPPGDTLNCITPDRVSKDPPAKASERIAAFLFARGDVMPSSNLIEIKLDARTTYDKLTAGNSIASRLTPLALLSGLGCRVDGGKNSAPIAPYTPVMVIEPGSGTAIKTTDGAEIAVSEANGTEMDKFVEQLRKKGVLDKQNRTDVAKNIFESDTRELYIDSSNNSFAVNTPRSQGVCLPKGPSSWATADISVDNLGAGMTLLLASLSTEPIAESNRLLLILCGDATNTDMVFKDESCKVLVNIGKAPVLVRVLDVNLSVRLAEPDKWELWALAQNGSRLEKIPLEVKDGKVTVKLNTATLKNGPTTYFEFVRTGNYTL